MRVWNLIICSAGLPGHRTGDPRAATSWKLRPRTPDSTLTFFAEQSLLCALSTCPGGDLSAWGWHQAKGDAGGKPDMKSTCRPIKVEVFELSEKVREEVLKDWKEPEASGYAGMHGMTVPGGEAWWNWEIDAL